MARGLQNYPNIDGPDSDFPDGRIRDNDGSGNGTPINEETNGDLQQFFAKIMREAGIAPNLLPESEYVGHQYYQALVALINSKISPVVLNDITDVFDTNTDTNPGISTFEITGLNAHKIGDMMHVNIYYYVTFLGDSGGGDTQNNILFQAATKPNAGKVFSSVRGIITDSVFDLEASTKTMFLSIVESGSDVYIRFDGIGTNNGGSYPRHHHGSISFSYKFNL
jgi:hypothetical protein